VTAGDLLVLPREGKHISAEQVLWGLQAKPLSCSSQIVLYPTQR